MADGGGETPAPAESSSAVPPEFEEARKFVIRQAVSAFAAIPALALVAYLFGQQCFTWQDSFLNAPQVIARPIEQVWMAGGLILVLTIASVGIFDKQVRRLLRWRRESEFKEGPRISEPTDTSFVRAAWGSLNEMMFMLLGLLLLGTGYCIGVAFLIANLTLAQVKGQCVRCETIRTSHGLVRGKILSSDSDHLLLMTGVGRFSLLKLDDIQEIAAASDSDQKAIAPSSAKAGPRP